MSVIQKSIIKRGKRSIVHQFLSANNDGKMIATWKLDLDLIRRVFDVRVFTWNPGREWHLTPNNQLHEEYENGRFTYRGLLFFCRLIGCDGVSHGLE